MPIFEKALSEMADGGVDTFGPVPFQAYLEANGLPTARTWQYVSVDSIDRLAPELRARQTMVFRLGSRSGASGTHFALAKYQSGWSDYFLFDEVLLSHSSPEAYLPNVSARQLFAFQLLPKLTETSLVNLAIGSGLLQHALGLSDDIDQVVPATGQSTFSFSIFPYAGMIDPWEHVNGQVEIDALFVGKRNKKETLFLVEAKSGKPNGSLSKHKLCYPLAALRSTVPAYIAIAPVYIKSWHDLDGQHFLVVECSIDAEIPFVICNLTPLTVHHFVLHGFGA